MLCPYNLGTNLAMVVGEMVSLLLGNLSCFHPMRSGQKIRKPLCGVV